jgi:hypothetical protein
MYKLLSGLCIVLGLACSGSSTADLGTIDAGSFRKDRGGCENIRGNMIANLKLNREKLLGLHENEVIKSLGRYDFQILDRKNEKVFIYYLEKGPQCEHIQNPSKATSMALYLNSISLVKEVTFQQGKP